MGRMLASMSRLCNRMDSDMRNLSSLEAICQFPPCLLFQVCRPLTVGMSMSLEEAIKVLNSSESLSSLRSLPFFSARFVIMLLSPPRIQWSAPWCCLTSSRSSSISSFSWSRWGPYTLVTQIDCPESGMLKITDRECLVDREFCTMNLLLFQNVINPHACSIASMLMHWWLLDTSFLRVSVLLEEHLDSCSRTMSGCCAN